MSNIKKETSYYDDGNEAIDGKTLYFKEVNSYPLLTVEEEIHYGKMLMNPEEKALLTYNTVDNYSMPRINIELLFSSLCNSSSYKDTIENLISFHNGLSGNNEKVLSMLKKYQIESQKLNRALNASELKTIFDIDYDENALSEKVLLEEIKAFINYVKAFYIFFNSNLRLPISIAGRYQCEEIDDMELIAEGNLGLMRAIVGYDVSLGNRFSTYATWWIKQGIRKYRRINATVVKIPECISSHLYAFRRKLRNLEKQGYTGLDEVEIAKRLHMPVDIVREFLIAMDSEVTMDDGLNEDEDMTLKDLLPSKDNVEETAMQKELRRDILQLLDVLNEREQYVIKMRFGIGEYHGKKCTIYDIGKMLSVSPQRVGQISAKALLKMKRATKSCQKQKCLIDYVYHQ